MKKRGGRNVLWRVSKSKKKEVGLSRRKNGALTTSQKCPVLECVHGPNSLSADSHHRMHSKNSRTPIPDNSGVEVGVYTEFSIETSEPASFSYCSICIGDMAKSIVTLGCLLPFQKVLRALSSIYRSKKLVKSVTAAWLLRTTTWILEPGISEADILKDIGKHRKEIGKIPESVFTLVILLLAFVPAATKVWMVILNLSLRLDNKLHSMSSKVTTTKCIINDTGSVSFVSKNSEIKEETVITSDHALELRSVLDWLAMVGNDHHQVTSSSQYGCCYATVIPKVTIHFRAFFPSYRTIIKNVSVITSQSTNSMVLNTLEVSRLSKTTSVVLPNCLSSCSVLVPISRSKIRPLIAVLKINWPHICVMKLIPGHPGHALAISKSE
ncbi:hypothetical protein VNO77_08562 [Canavalia gladiata]|uniref:Uncharacterized protein n=1 Tax=Canavalia gladiata TaxID=3824 RepID=A0AAN9MA52_CANGL